MLRASLFAWASQPFLRWFRNTGMAMAARMPMMMMTTRSSMRVKPSSSWALRIRASIAIPPGGGGDPAALAVVVEDSVGVAGDLDAEAVNGRVARGDSSGRRAGRVALDRGALYVRGRLVVGQDALQVAGVLAGATDQVVAGVGE